MNFSTRLDEAMRKAGFKSQNALARASGVSQSSINRILKSTGISGPETTTVRKLADACGVSFEWLNDGIIGKSSSKDKEMERYALVYVNEVELKIITHYREATLAGQSLLETMAEDLPKASPPDAVNDES
ncbi:helix-turn-helix domain-containing protein [Undibacterium sp. SXout11W]|uniref:helix-turn-helix domain-containing protein n=1 Tax=Undibacterium sp. SXout11W TaxID=3413050 RepID=UPI003BF3AD11